MLYATSALVTLLLLVVPAHAIEVTVLAKESVDTPAIVLVEGRIEEADDERELERAALGPGSLASMKTTPATQPQPVVTPRRPAGPDTHSTNQVYLYGFECSWNGPVFTRVPAAAFGRVFVWVGG
jgi:hypothetical protein